MVQEGSSLSPSYYTYISMSGAPYALEFKEKGRDAITCTDTSDINSCGLGAMSDYMPVEVQPGVFAFTTNSGFFGLLMGPTFNVLFSKATIILKVPSASKNTGTLGGICGNYNGDDADDKALRDGTLSTSATAITESWATGSC